MCVAKRQVSHLDVRGVDVACVVFLVGHKLHAILLVRNDVTETVALRVLGQSRRGEDAVGLLLGHLLVLSEDPLLLQLQLQGLTLQRQRRRGGGVLAIENQATQPKGFYSFTLHHT